MGDLEIHKLALINILNNQCLRYLQFKLLNLETSYDFGYMREKFDTFYQNTAYQFEKRAIYDTQYSTLNLFMSKNGVFDGKDYLITIKGEGISLEIKQAKMILVLDIIDLPQQIVEKFSAEMETIQRTAMYWAFNKIAVMIDEFYNEYCATIPQNQLDAIKKINQLEIKCQEEIFKIKNSLISH